MFRSMVDALTTVALSIPRPFKISCSLLPGTVALSATLRVAIRARCGNFSMSLLDIFLRDEGVHFIEHDHWQRSILRVLGHVRQKVIGDTPFEADQDYRMRAGFPSLSIPLRLSHASDIHPGSFPVAPYKGLRRLPSPPYARALVFGKEGSSRPPVGNTSSRSFFVYFNRWSASPCSWLLKPFFSGNCRAIDLKISALSSAWATFLTKPRSPQASKRRLIMEGKEGR